MKKAVWLLWVGVLFAAVGCASGTEGGVCEVDLDCPAPQACIDGACVGTGAVEIADNVKYLEATDSYQSLVREPDRLIFTFSEPAEDLGVELDDIIVGTEGTGYLRRVESVQTDGNRLILDTRIAALDEALAGDISIKVDWANDARYDGRFGQLTQPAMLDYDLAGTELLSLSKEITCGGDNTCHGGPCDTGANCPSGYTCDGDDDPGDGTEDGVCKESGTGKVWATLKVTIESGYVRFDPGIDVVLRTGWFSGLKHFHIWISGQFDLDMTVKAEASVGMSYEKEVTIYTYEKTFLKLIGWFPVEGTAKFEVLAGFSVAAEVAGSVTTGFDAHAFLKMGGAWAKGEGWSPVWEEDFTRKSHDPVWALEGTVTIKVWVKPDFEVLLYESVGPAFNIEGYLKWKGWFLPVQCWKLFWGVVIKAEIRLGGWIKEGLDLQPPAPWTLFDTGDLFIVGVCSEKVCKEGTEEIWETDTTTDELTSLVEDCAQREPPMVCDEGKCIEGGFGDMAGRIEDALTHDPIAGATIEVYKNGAMLFPLTSGVDGRYALTEMAVGTYNLHISADGYIPADVVVQIRNGQVSYVTPLRQLPQNCDGLGSASGQVIDAVTGLGLSKAELEFRAGVGVKTGPVVGVTTADGAGFYTMPLLPAGNYTAEVRMINYATNWADVIVCGYNDGDDTNDDIPNQNIVLSPLSDGNYRVLLTWGEEPLDLDAHMSTPSIGGAVYHIFYRSGCRGSRDEAPYADLDIDDRSSFGPETITIAQFHPGTYTFSVHNYGAQNKEETGSLSSARVQVFSDTGELLHTFNSPGGGGYFWNVFSIDGNSKELTPINTVGGGSNPADYEEEGVCFPQ
jgi:hypothetical protein